MDYAKLVMVVGGDCFGASLRKIMIRAGA